MECKRVAAQPDSLTIEWADGTLAEFASLWLRDNLATHRDSHSGQRLIDVTDLPAAPRIRRAATEGGALVIHWESDAEPAHFALDWLAAQAASPIAERPERLTCPWLDGAALEARRAFAWAPLAQFRDVPAVRLEWLTRLLQTGIAFLHDVPAVESSLLATAAMLGRVCETNYGLAFDVRSVPQPDNLAYSDLGLGLHTDNPYREPVPGFQALHVLRASPDGGSSLFADGIAIAGHLRETDPAAFETLTDTPVPFLYRSRDTELYAERPLIQLDCSGAIRAVHYNSRSIAPLRLARDATLRFYAAYRRFAELLREPRYQMTCGLENGALVVFDNQRILHGRTAFSSARYARHLRGCYLTRDSVYATTAQLRRSLSGRQQS